MTLLSDQSITEEWKGPEEIIQKSIVIMSKIKLNYDLCTDSTGPRTVMHAGPIRDAYMNLKKRGVKVRMITEITGENLAATKEFMEIAEVRHIEAVTGNFVIADGTDYAGSPETVDGILMKLMVSNIATFVKQQQYFFELLWEKAMPAEQRIKQLEEGIEPEITEVLTGWDNIFKRNMLDMSMARQRVNSCCDAQVPGIIVESPMYGATVDFLERGGKVRMITEIAAENLSSVRKLMKIIEIRHINGFKINFGLSENSFMAPTSVYSTSSNPQCIYSNSKDLIREHQYLFETLWEKAIPAEQRIRQIEEGTEPEKIELIPDTRKSVALAFEIMKRTKEELIILFATPRTFILGYSLGSVEAYDQMSKRGVNVRLLVPNGSQIENEVAKVRELNPSINVRVSDADLSTNITILVSDRKEFISWELRDDTLSDPYEAGGTATYSTIQSLASSYGTIFDNLWKITEFTENLKAANVKLENSEKSMKEFIDVAAHELRTPIQPIIGLADLLREKSSDPGQSELLDAIIRNAQRLRRLQENILDVTKIENQLIRYDKEVFNIDELIAQLVRDVQNSTADSELPGISLDLQAHSTVAGDKQRIVQVILNLLGNSMKFTKDGTIGISSRLKDGEVLVNVIDTGKGIDPEIMPQLFSKFATKSPTGTGLGLFISKSILEGHGGRIWAENNKGGKGASFTFALPALSEVPKGVEARMNRQ